MKALSARSVPPSAIADDFRGATIYAVVGPRRCGTVQERPRPRAFGVAMFPRGMMVSKRPGPAPAFRYRVAVGRPRRRGPKSLRRVAVAVRTVGWRARRGSRANRHCATGVRGVNAWFATAALILRPTTPPVRVAMSRASFTKGTPQEKAPSRPQKSRGGGAASHDGLPARRERVHEHVHPPT